MFNPASSGFHPFGNPQQHSGATTTHMNVGLHQQGIIGHNTPMNNNNMRKSLLDSLHQQPVNSLPNPSSSNNNNNNNNNGMMNHLNGLPTNSLFYSNSPSNNNNPTLLGGNNNNMNSNNNTLYNSHFVQSSTLSHTTPSLLNHSQQQQTTNPLVNDGFTLLGSNKLFSSPPSNNNHTNLSSNLLRNNNIQPNNNLASTSPNPFGLSLLGSSSGITEPIGVVRSHVTSNVPNMGNNISNAAMGNGLNNNLNMGNTLNNGLNNNPNLSTMSNNLNGNLNNGLNNNNLNNPTGSLLSSFHNDFGNNNRNTSFQQYNNLPMSGNNNNNGYTWVNNNNMGGNNGFGNNNIGGTNAGLMNGGQLLLNNSSSVVGGSNSSSFYSPFLSINQTSNSPSIGQQSHLPLFGTNTTATHNDSFFSNSGQFGGFNQQQQPIGRNKSSNEVDFSYLTSSLPLDDDDESFISNQTTNPLFEDPFQKTIHNTPLFSPQQQQQAFPGISSSPNTSSGNSTNDNTTATPSPPPPQFLSSAPEYHNRVLAMASSQYPNPQQSPTNTNFNYGSSTFSMMNYNGFPNGNNNLPFTQQNSRGNIPPNGTLNESNHPFIPSVNGQSSTVVEHPNEMKHTGNGYQYVFAPPPPATQANHVTQTLPVSTVEKDSNVQPKKEPTEKKIINPEVTLVSPVRSSNTPLQSEKKDEPKKKQDLPQPTVAQKSKSKKKNTSKSTQEVKSVEIKPTIVDSPKSTLSKEEPLVKSEQEKLDEELAKKLQREFELEYLRNLENNSKPKNNSFTTPGKKKKALEGIPEKLPLASSSSLQSNSFSLLESVPADIQQPNEKTTKKQTLSQPVASKNSKKNKKKKNEPILQPKKEEMVEKVENKVELEKVDNNPKTETKEEDYNKPCRDHFKGKCKFGSGICPYSHDRSFYIKYQQEHPDEFPPLATPKSKKKETADIIPEPQVPQKKTEVCMKHSSIQSCSNGKNCKYIHMPDISLHDLYRKCCTGHSDRICKCSPQNDPPILYIEGVTKLTKKQMQEINEKSFMKALGVFKMTEQDLYQNLPELKSIPSAERKHKRFLYIFPDTCVKLIISKIERSEANRVKKLFNETEEEDLRKRQAELSAQRYDQEKDDELHPTWQIIGLTSHQHCILRFIESMLPLCFAAPDCDSYGEGEPFDEAMYGHPIYSYDLRLYPSIMERIFEMIAPDDEADEDLSKELLMMMLGKACEKKKPPTNQRPANPSLDPNYANLVNCIGPIIFDPNHH